MAKIVVCHAHEDRYPAEIVTKAVERSFSAAQVVQCDYDAGLDVAPQAAVLINPSDEQEHLVRGLADGGRKVLVTGRIGPRLQEVLGLTFDRDIPVDPKSTLPEVDPAKHHNESRAAIRYDRQHALGRCSPHPVRPLCRYDFADEWNNLGFGPIRADGGPWSIAGAARPAGAFAIAWLGDAERPLSLYAAIRDLGGGSLLWFNRPVGPVDSLEWSIVESFFRDYRPDELICFPSWSEVPERYAAAVTMRLDCDEAVASSRPLVELYREHGLPLSLAVKTAQKFSPEDNAVLRDVIASGGSVVPHSVHHRPNWGGNYDAALREAADSKAWVEQQRPEAQPVQYAVSPFHQSPPFAMQALADLGFAGLVGSSVACWPEATLGRAGQAPLIKQPFVVHGAQCMLHGDCYRRYGHSIDTYLESFEAHAATGSLFGYLDHPFSARYQYGWTSEAERLDVHQALIGAIRSHGPVWWPNLVDALRSLSRRAASSVELADDGTLIGRCPSAAGLPPLSVLWKDRRCSVQAS